MEKVVELGGLFEIQDQSIDSYWGIGAGVTIPGSFEAFMLSARIPFGIQIPFELDNGHTCEAFLEIVPLIFVFPVPAMSFTTSLGARYVF